MDLWIVPTILRRMARGWSRRQPGDPDHPGYWRAQCSERAQRRITWRVREASSRLVGAILSGLVVIPGAEDGNQRPHDDSASEQKSHQAESRERAGREANPAVGECETPLPLGRVEEQRFDDADGCSDKRGTNEHPNQERAEALDWGTIFLHLAHRFPRKAQDFDDWTPEAMALRLTRCSSESDKLAFGGASIGGHSARSKRASSSMRRLAARRALWRCR